MRVAEAAKQGKDGMAGFGQAIGDMVSKTQGNLSPTLAGLVQSLDLAGLSAAGAQVKVDEAGRSVATFPNGKTVVLNADTSPVPGQLAFVKGLIDGTRGTVGVDADTGPGVATVGGFKLTTDATTGTVTINGNITPADQARLGIQAKTDGTTGTMWIDGNPVPADGRLNGMRVTVDRTTGVMSIDANKDPADAQSRRAHDAASTPAGFAVGADYRPAGQAAEGFWAQQWREIKEFGAGVAHWFGNLFSTGGPVPPPERHMLGGLVGQYAFGGPVGFPIGGPVSGPGSATSDSIPARLSDGEFVVRAAAVRAIGVPALEQINSMGYAAGGLVGYAAGGGVDAAAPAAGGLAAARRCCSARGRGCCARSAARGPGGRPAARRGRHGPHNGNHGSDGGHGLQTAADALLAGTVAGEVTPGLAAATAAAQNLVAAGTAPLVADLVGVTHPALAQTALLAGTTDVAALNLLTATHLPLQAANLTTAAVTTGAWLSNSYQVAASSLAQRAEHSFTQMSLGSLDASTRGTQYQTAASWAANNAAVQGSWPARRRPWVGCAARSASPAARSERSPRGPRSSSTGCAPRPRTRSAP